MAVTKTNNLEYGMKDTKGSTDIADLQRALNATGRYNLDVDGSFGPKTLEAVNDYQKNTPGLVEDGVVGTNTWGKLTATKPDANPTQGNTFTTPAGNTYEKFTPKEFKPDKLVYSDAVIQAGQTLAQMMSNMPGEYKPIWEDEADSYKSQYENRDPFSYNANEDALYQQYKDQYIQQGKLAMMDAMGQAAALNGGYGSSYAQAVGQQAYNQQLSQLNAIIPELYNRAYGVYQDEGQKLLNMYNMYMEREAQARANHDANVSQFFTELGAVSDYHQTLRGNEFDDWYTQAKMDFDQHYADEDIRVAEKENLIGLITATGYEPTDSELEYAGISREQANAYLKAYDESQISASPGDKYETLTREESSQWLKEGQKQETWSGLSGVWNRMKMAKHDPLESAAIIKEVAGAKGIKPTEDELYDLGDKMVAAGASDDEVTAFIGDWMMELGLIKTKEPQMIPERKHIVGGSGGGSGWHIAAPY